MRRLKALGLLLGGLMTFSSFSEAKESAEVVFDFSAKPSTCNLTAPLTYNLGDLPLGTKKDYASFEVAIDCPVSMKTAIIAKNLDGILNAAGKRVTIPMSNAGADEGPFFWLTHNSSRIYLRGLESDAFCSSTGTVNRCSLTPETEVYENSPWGTGAVTIIFTVIYPA